MEQISLTILLIEAKSKLLNQLRDQMEQWVRMQQMTKSNMRMMLSRINTRTQQIIRKRLPLMAALMRSTPLSLMTAKGVKLQRSRPRQTRRIRGQVLSQGKIMAINQSKRIITLQIRATIRRQRKQSMKSHKATKNPLCHRKTLIQSKSLHKSYSKRILMKECS